MYVNIEVDYKFTRIPRVIHKSIRSIYSVILLDEVLCQKLRIFNILEANKHNTDVGISVAGYLFERDFIRILYLRNYTLVE